MDHYGQMNGGPAQAEWSRLKGLVRLAAEGETFARCDLGWVRDDAFGLDYLRMHDVQADLPDRRMPSGYRIYFGRPSRSIFVADPPDQVVWTLEPTSSDVFTWSVRGLEATFPSAPLAEKIVMRLVDYCSDYESSVLL